MMIEQMLEQYTPSRGGTTANLAVVLEYAQKRIEVIVAHGETPRLPMDKIWQRILDGETTPDIGTVRTYIRMYYSELEQRGQAIEWPFDWR